MKYWLFVTVYLFITLFYTNNKLIMPSLLLLLLITSVVLYFRNLQYHRQLLTLQENQKKTQYLFENILLPYQLLDKNGRLLHINHAWLKLINVSDKKVTGQFFHDFISAESKPSLDTMLLNIEKQPEGDLIVRIGPVSDKTQLILVKWQVIENETKQFQYIQCILIDMTELYEIEHSLKESQNALAAVYEDLVQFTYIAAHHLQEPSRRIVTFTQRLNSQLAQEIQLNQDISVILNFIEQSAIRQKLLVHDIQRYLAAIKPIAQIEKLSLNNIMLKVLNYHASLIKETNAQIEYDDLPTVHFDFPRLYDIFKLVLDNALHYRHPERTPHIKINAQCQNGRVYIRVADNGIGIPEEYKERVFLVFERLSMDNNSNSTGIGLAIVRRIIISGHGQIKIEDTPNGGVTLLFDLPK